MFVLRHEQARDDQPILLIERNETETAAPTVSFYVLSTKPLQEKIKAVFRDQFRESVQITIDSLLQKRIDETVILSINSIIQENLGDTNELHLTSKDISSFVEITFQALMQSLKNDEDLVDTYTTLNTFWALYETQKESNTINLGISPRYVEVTLPQKSN